MNKTKQEMEKNEQEKNEMEKLSVIHGERKWQKLHEYLHNIFHELNEKSNKETDVSKQSNLLAKMIAIHDIQIKMIDLAIEEVHVYVTTNNSRNKTAKEQQIKQQE